MNTDRSSSSDYILSVVAVAGPQRARFQRMLDSMFAQQTTQPFEVVVVDLLGENALPFTAPATAHVRTIVGNLQMTFGESRAAGYGAASGDVIAFVEDHVVAQPGWAQAIMDGAANHDWVIASYAFISYATDTIISRIGFMTEYGNWRAPAATGPIVHLPSGNLIYRRAFLAECDTLADALATDVTLKEQALASGRPIYLLGDAVLAHEGFDTWSAYLKIHLSYLQTIGYRNATDNRWPWWRRIAYAPAIVTLGPWVRALRVLRTYLRPPRNVMGAFASFPAILLLCAVDCVAEALGVLRRDSYTLDQGLMEAETFEPRNPSET